MAVAQISKVQIYSTKNHKNSIVELIQDQGIIQIESFDKNDETLSEKTDNLSNVEYDLAGIKFAITYLKKYAPTPKGNLIKKINASFLYATKEQVKKKAEASNYKELIIQTQKLEKTLNDEKNNITKLTVDKQKLEQWKNLGTLGTQKLKSTNIYIGEVKDSQFSDFFEKISKDLTLAHIEKINESIGNTQFLIIYTDDSETEVKKILHQFDAKTAELPEIENNISQTIKKIEQELKESKNKLKLIEKDSSKYAKNLSELKIIHDYLTWQKDQEETKSNAAQTKFAFSIKGWMPTSQIDDLKKKLSKITNEFELVSKNPNKDDKVPVLLQNKKLSSPFEFITHLYGSPKYNEMDPSPFLAPFFVIFFGLCLTDAGYGILLIFLILLAIKIFQIPKPNQKMFHTIIWGSISTVIAGALFGGWFGIQLDVLPASPIKSLLTHIRIIDPMKNPLSILILSLGLGYFQVIIGILMGMYWKIKQGEIKAAIFDYGFWASLLTSLLFWYLANSQIFLENFAPFWKGLIIFSAAGLVLTQGRNKKSIIGKSISGILSLYNIVGYGSDILSYSRLLALGLSTAVIAMVVNLMSSLVYDMIPYVGWIFAIIILIGGHLFNIAINVLGAYIHSMRLQFVEFFPKFMEGGGDIFIPFKKNNTYVRIVDPSEKK